MGACFETRDKRYWSAIKFAHVRSAKQERGRRNKYFPSELFAEPAWDILLELYLFQLVGRVVSETELAEKITAPPSVSIRWMKVLEGEHLVARAVDPNDSTQIQVELTPGGLHAMETFFSDQE